MIKKKRKRPVRHRRKFYVRKDGTPVAGTIVNPDIFETSPKDRTYFHKRVLRHPIPETIGEAIDKGDLIEEDYTKLELWEIARNNNLPDYKKKFNKLNKRGYINFIIEEEMARQEIFIEPKTEEQKRKKRYYPKYHTRIKPELMEKELGIEIMNASRELAKEDREYAIGIDFEKSLKDPQRIIAVRGKEASCLKIDDVEIFGHTHPSEKYPIPSTKDLLTMVPYKPEFIVAGETGEIIIYNIKDPQKFKEWEKKKRTEIVEGKWKSNYYAMMFYKNNTADKTALKHSENRERFLKETGVEIRDYKPNMKLKVPKDKDFEKYIS
nr:MAG: hypothetical protein [uncultured archaeon]